MISEVIRSIFRCVCCNENRNGGHLAKETIHGPVCKRCIPDTETKK